MGRQSHPVASSLAIAGKRRIKKGMPHSELGAVSYGVECGVLLFGIVVGLNSQVGSNPVADEV
jgi:hypothetical protein